MRITQSVLVLALLFPFLSGVALAEPPGSFPLLKMAPDARAAALGESGTAGAVGAMAAFHNPALLAFSDRSQAAFAYTDWLLDVTIQSGALMFAYSKLTVGLSFNVFTVPDIELRDAPMDDPLSTFAAHDLAAGISLGYRIKPNTSFGLTGRMLYQQIYNQDAYGFCGDLGVAHRFAFHDFVVSAALRNLGQMGNLQEEDSPLPSSATLGISGIILHYHDVNLRGLGDAQILLEDNTRIHAGLEGSWKEIFFLRGGYQSGSELRRFSGGLGLAWKGYGFDYAYQPFLENFEASHRFTLSINF